MRIRLKVCCIASPEEARLAVAHGADALGLVGPMPSGPGTIDDALAADIARSVPPPVATVLLTSREEADAIAAHVAIVGAGVVQIVRHVDRREYPRLRRRLPTTKLMQVVHVEDDASIDLARAYAEVADALLLDSGRPGASVAELGGTGRAHDWDVSRRIVESVATPVFLAGGLAADNLRRAVTTVRPYGLDVCTGVRSGGRLDAGKLAAFAATLWDNAAASPPASGSVA
jgi:phosphoribosylanthranilate isomerase